MKLALKFTLAFLLGMCAVHGAYAYFISVRETDAFESDIKRDQHVLGHAIATAFAALWRQAGPEEAQSFIAQANRAEAPNRVSVRWAWIDALTTAPQQRAMPAAAVDDLLRGREYVWTDYEGDTAGRVRTLLPVEIPGRGLGAVEIGESRAEIPRYTRETTQTVLLAMAAVVAVSALLAIVLGIKIVGQPVTALIAHARRVAGGDLTGRLHLHPRDELRELAGEMNDMTTQLEIARERLADETAAKIATIEQLRHADRLKTVGQLASGIAHELGTPLNVVWARARMIVKNPSPPDDAAANAKIIADQSERMTKIIQQLLGFARPRAPRRVDSDLCQIADRMKALLSSIAERKSVAVEVKADEGAVEAYVDPDQFQQVLSNLILNGIQAMRRPGTITIGLGHRQARPPADHGGPEDEYVYVSVTDEGEGIPEANLRRLFEPFFTTKQVGEGTGLGLSVSRGIITEHGGWMSVASRVGEGTCFTIYLPRRSGDAGQGADRR